MRQQEKKYKPKVVRAIKIPARGWQEYREELKGQGFTVNDFKAMQKADQFFNGLELYLSMWNYDNHSSWHLWNWDKEQDERVKLALYHAEQYHPFPSYKNDFEGFCKAWEAGEYDPGASYTFRLDQVEVLEVLQEEENNIEPDTVKKGGKPGQRSRVPETPPGTCHEEKIPLQKEKVNGWRRKREKGSVGGSRRHHGRPAGSRPTG